MKATKPNVKALVAQIPDSDKPGETSTFTGPEPGVADDIHAAILDGGRDSLLELIALVHDPNDRGPGDFRAEYVLHGLAVHVGRPGKEKQRKMLADTLASQLGSRKVPKAVQGFLIRELQVVGDARAVRILGKMLADEELCEYAAQALVAIGPDAAGQLRSALGKVKGRCRVTIVQNLGVARDGWRTMRLLRKCLSDQDRDVRLAAAWALARMGDAASVDSILKMANAEPGWERIKATQACLVLAESLKSARKKEDAAKIYAQLRNTRTDATEQYIRKAAEKALAAMG
jgi:HEAT repeat protein